LGGSAVLGFQGLLRLEGGALSAGAIVNDSMTPIAEVFLWTAGTLRVKTCLDNLTVPSAGVLSPIRSPQGATISGDYNQQTAGATLAVEIGGPFQFTEFGVLTVLETASLGGNLQITLTNEFIPTNLNSFDILRANGGLTGAFANVANGQRLMTSDGLGSFVVNYGPGNPNPNHIVLSACAHGSLLPGDYNQNGVVDAADYVVWRNTRGQSGSGLGADGNGNGQIDAGDYAVWRAHFGQSSGVGAILPGGAPAPAVPESASAVLLTLGFAAFFPCFLAACGRPKSLLKSVGLSTNIERAIVRTCRVCPSPTRSRASATEAKRYTARPLIALMAFTVGVLVHSGKSNSHVSDHVGPQHGR
jgi:hypothetical protein